MPFTGDYTITTLASPTTDVNADDVLIPDADLLGIHNDLKNGVKGLDILKFNKNSVTIASDAISLTNQPRYIVVDTEAAAASDTLSTISGGADGQVIFLYAANAARVVNVVHNVGNIKLAFAQTVQLSVDRPLMLFYNGTTWGDVLNSAAMAVERTRTLVSAAASITISNIPGIYKHLLLIIEARTDLAATIDAMLLRFNGDSSAANYTSQWLAASGTSVTAGEFIGVTSTGIFLPSAAPGNTGSAGNGYCIIQIPNYTSSTMRRLVDVKCGALAANTSTNMKKGDSSGVWQNTVNPITSITFLPNGGANIAANSAYTLYGLN